MFRDFDSKDMSKKATARETDEPDSSHPPKIYPYELRKNELHQPIQDLVDVLLGWESEFKASSGSTPTTENIVRTSDKRTLSIGEIKFYFRIFVITIS
jgi:hypothetical protein